MGKRPATSIAGKAEPRPIFQAIVEELGAALSGGELNPGDRLPTVEALSRRFGVSRVVVREALRHLEQQGLVYVKRGYGGGTFVASPNTRPVQDSFMAMLRTGQISMQDLAEARAIYEPEIARLAALRATEAQLGHLADVIHRQETALKEGNHEEEFDLTFHRLVAESTHNSVILTAINSIVNIVLAELQHLELDRATEKSIVAFHKKIYDALSKHDPDSASELMARHLVDVQKRLARLQVKQRGVRKV